jgi:hypothetical protein
MPNVIAKVANLFAVSVVVVIAGVGAPVAWEPPS